MSNNLPFTQEFNINPAQFFEKTQALPPDKQAEVLDFIEFLAARSQTQLREKECLADRLLTMPDVGLDEDFARVEESQAMRSREEEPPLYPVDDLKERWQ